MCKRKSGLIYLTVEGQKCQFAAKSKSDRRSTLIANVNIVNTNEQKRRLYSKEFFSLQVSSKMISNFANISLAKQRNESYL